MLKWFVKYNKILLVVFGVLLMVSFTIGTVALDTFLDRAFNLIRYGSTLSPGDTIGKTESYKITTLDEQEAYEDQKILGAVLGSVNPVLPRMIIGDDELRWALALQEARRAGLWASNQEVAQMLGYLGIDSTERMARLEAVAGYSDPRIREAVRHFLMVENYRQLVSGTAFQPMEDGIPTQTYARLSDLREAAQTFQMAQQLYAQSQNPSSYFRASALMRQANMLFMLADGAPRYSEPSLEYLFASRGAQVSGQYVLVGNRVYQQDVPAPTEQELQALFDQYKDELPGRSEPYGFGYKFPDRVKLEALTLPIAPIREKVRPDVEVDIAAAMEFYEQHKDQMVARNEMGEPTGEKLSFEQARPRIIERLIDERANEKAMTIAKQARAILTQNLANVEQEGGYYQLPDDFKPVSMRVAADKLAQQQDVRVTLTDAQLADQWQTMNDLVQIEDLGMSVLASAPQVPLVEYVKSAKQMNPPITNPLITRRLQVNVPSEIMADRDGSLSVFRLTAASPEHSPESLETVRDQVTNDARQLAAFKKLMENQSQWTEQGRSKGLEAVAQELDGQVIPFPALSQARGQVPGIGRSESFIDGVFDMASKLDKPGSLESLPANERIGSAPVDSELALALFELQEFMPISRQEFLNALSEPQGVALANAMIERDLQNPMSLESIIQRSGFKYSPGREPDVEDDPDYAPTP